MDISLDNFEDFIDSVILERGDKIWQNGYIVSVEEIDYNDFSAVIAGSEAYAVNIVLNNKNNIFTHSCTCPYDGGPFCKHKAALLFVIKAARQKGIPFAKGDLHSIQSAIGKVSEKRLQQLIIELAKGNLQTREKIKFLLGLTG